MKTPLLTFLSFILSINWALGQIRVSFPISRIVFQRNQNNRANFSIAGTYYQPLDRIEARVVPVEPGQGTETPWYTIASPNDNYFRNGVFQGNFEAVGGWYHLEVRGWSGGSVVVTDRVERVGVGEVFLVAGQSNAEGSTTYPGATRGANDDRVSTIPFRRFERGDLIMNEDEMPFFFQKLENDKEIGPYNPVPWVWARLGDMLTRRLNVPVLFYGCAIGGLEIDGWKRSAQGEDLRNSRGLFVKFAGSPYKVMQLALQHYASRTGLRGILWHQGESDRNNSALIYADALRTVINKSRSDFQHNISWMVARVAIPEGQNQVINGVPNVFGGPNTDVIPEVPLTNAFRFDGHFANAGIDWAAELWNASLDDSYFRNSQPKEPRHLIPIVANCNADKGRNQLILEPASNYAQYRWSNGQGSKVTEVGPGLYGVRVKDASGFPYFSQEIDFKEEKVVFRPSISNIGSDNFCEGLTTKLRENSGQNVDWNNGAFGSVIDVSGGEYFAIKANTFGCRAESNRIRINTKPKPTARINVTGNTTFCRGDSVVLTAQQALKYSWSNGSRNPTITIQNSGNYELTVENQEGCIDKQSVTVKVNELPQVRISPNGVVRTCPENPIVLESNQPNLQNIWSNGASSARITPTQNGNYSLRVRDSNGCLSVPDTAKFQFFTSPVANIITEGGVNAICEGKSVELYSKDDFVIYEWSNLSNQKRISVNRQGTYTLRVRDGNGCLSQASRVDIVVRANPKVPVIEQKGIYQLEAIATDYPAKFEWRLEDKTIENGNQALVKAVKSAFYTVRAGFTYPIGNQTLTCFSNYSPPYSFVLDPSLGLILYPNPTSDGIINVEVKEDLKNVSVELYNRYGVKVLSAKLPDLTQKRFLDLRELPKDYYILKIFNDGFYVQERRIVLDY
ncbi:MAG: sialate O-acetylesterase [Spirosomataceae bacterium]